MKSNAVIAPCKFCIDGLLYIAHLFPDLRLGGLMSSRTFGNHHRKKSTPEGSLQLVGTGVDESVDSSQILETLLVSPVPLHFNHGDRSITSIEYDQVRSVAFIGHLGRTPSSHLRARAFDNVSVRCFQQEALVRLLTLVHRLRDASDEKSLDTGVMQPPTSRPPLISLVGNTRTLLYRLDNL